MNQKKPDIRNYIPVYGRVLRVHQILYPKSEHPNDVEAPLRPLKQSSIDDFKLNNRPPKEQHSLAPAHVFSKGVRRKVKMIDLVGENEEQTIEPDTCIGERLPLKKKPKATRDEEQATVHEVYKHPPTEHTAVFTTKVTPDQVLPDIPPCLNSNNSYELNESSKLFIDTNELLADLSDCEKL